MKMSGNILRTVQLLLAFSIVALNSQCNGCGPFFLRSKTEKPGLYSLTIGHINDFHARFLEVNGEGWPCHRGIDEHCFGGLPRTLTAANMLKEKIPNSIFLNAGDHYQGTAWYNIHKWNATVEFLNMLPHDVITIGNHDFDDDITGLIPFLQNFNVPVVLSNVITTSESELQNLIQKSYVIEKGGRKIGVIGVIFEKVWKRSKVGHLWFTNEIETINEEAKKLKEQGVNIIIVLSHCGITIDREIAENCPDVDVIVGGHSHSFLYTGPTAPPYDIPVDEYPVVVNQPKTNRKVLIVQAFAFTKYLGILSVWVDDDGEIVEWNGRPLLLDDTIEQDQDMLKRLEPYKRAVESKSTEVVGRSTYTLRRNCRYHECIIGNMITDAMVASYVGRSDGPYWTDAAIAINYVGAIKKAINAGSITYGDLIMTLPFDDTWDIIEVQGKDLRQALEDSFSSNFWRGRTTHHSSFVWSGIDLVFDTSDRPISRVVEVRVRCQKCLVPSYEYLKDDEWYRIVVPGFIAHHGGSSKLAKNKRNHVIGHDDIDQLAAYIGMMNPLNYGSDYRIYFCNRGVDRKCGKNYRRFHPRQSIFPDEFLRNLDNNEPFVMQLSNEQRSHEYYTYH